MPDNTQSYLFVGGSWDGMMLPVTNVEKQDYVIKAVRSHCSITNPTIHHRVQSYKRIAMRDVNGVVIYFYLCGGNVNSPLQELITGYASLRSEFESY